MKKLSCMPIALLAAVAFLPTIPPAAQADTGAWRCGNTYADRPCQGGEAVELDTDARDDAQKREADRATREARAAADRMQRERLQQDAQRRPLVILGTGEGPGQTQPSAPRGAEKRAAGTTRKGKQDAAHFSAHDPGTSKKSRKRKARARRAGGE